MSIQTETDRSYLLQPKLGLLNQTVRVLCEGSNRKKSMAYFIEIYGIVYRLRIAKSMVYFIDLVLLSLWYSS